MGLRDVLPGCLRWGTEGRTGNDGFVRARRAPRKACAGHNGDRTERGRGAPEARKGRVGSRQHALGTDRAQRASYPIQACVGLR